MSLSKEQLESKLKNILKDEVSVISYNTWILPLTIKDIINDSIVLITTNEFHKGLIENKYRQLIENTLIYITNKNWNVEIICKPSTNKVISMNQLDDITTQKIENSTASNSCLDHKLTFNTFVVGNNNKFAHAASLCVGDNKSKAYNPLFLYGGVGLGKTHLMHAIGNRRIELNKNTNVLYVTSEKFTNQLINAIKDNKSELFRSKYRTIDVLLIDDIQFIAGKESAQEEFFHTFNTLVEDGKQIIISSDKPPRDIQFLEDRLKSRFEGGLLVDVSCPDYETRLAILRKKAQIENVNIIDSVLSEIAINIDSNIRELEGVFNKIIARASLVNSPISIELAQNIIHEIQSNNKTIVSAFAVKKNVAEYFNITTDDLASNKRSNDITFPRQIAMYLCRHLAKMSYPQIGIDFGGRDHSTVMHACKKIEREINELANTKLIVESVHNLILSQDT